MYLHVRPGGASLGGRTEPRAHRGDPHQAGREGSRTDRGWCSKRIPFGDPPLKLERYRED